MSLPITISSVTQSSFTARVSTSGAVPMQHNWYLDDDNRPYDTIQTRQGERSSSCSFSGLDPGMTYTVSVRVFAFNPWRELDSGRTTARTEAAPLVSETYYAKLILNGNGGKTPMGYDTYGQFTGWMGSWSGGADIDIDFYDPGFIKHGCTLIGWSRSPSAAYPSYDPSDSVSIYSESTNQNAPTTVTLYAVWGSARPRDWNWSSNVSSGASFGLTALEWNGFIDRIEDFAAYVGVTLNASNLSKGKAVRGSQMNASQANAVCSLINQLSPPISVPASVSSGEPITAAFVNGLKDSLNSIL